MSRQQYYNQKRKTSSKFDSIRIKHIVEEIPFKNGLDILDIGAENLTSYLLLKTKLRSFNYEVMNISKKRTECFKNICKIHIQDICKKCIKTKYDVIIMGEIIEHLPNPEIALKNVKTMLKSNGLFIGTTPNALSLRHIGKAILKIPIGHEKEHLLSFNVTSLKSLLEHSRFKNIKIKYLGGWIPFIKIYLPCNRLGEHLLFKCEK